MCRDRCESRLRDRECGDREARQIDRKHAPDIRKVARVNAAVARLDGPSAEGEAETQAAPIGAALLERVKQVLHAPTREASTLVLDLNEHAIGVGADAVT